MSMKQFMRGMVTGVAPVKQATEEQREKLRKVGIKPAMSLTQDQATKLLKDYHSAKQMELSNELLSLRVRDAKQARKERKKRQEEARNRAAQLDQDRKEREAKQELARNNGPELER